MIRVLTLSTLYPDCTRPNFGVFVERQTRGLASHPHVSLRVVSPRGLPPWPIALHPHYRARGRLPAQDEWRGITVDRPAFPVFPATGSRFSASMMARALVPLLTRVRREFPFDVIDAEFFFPDGPAAIALGRHFDVPVSIKARGSDIHHWGTAPETAKQLLGAALQADGLLAVSDALADDMANLGMPRDRIMVHRTGVDRTLFAPRDKGAARRLLNIDGPLVVSLGALIPRKGHDIVIDAVAALPGVHLLIIGEGPERARLGDRIAGHGEGGRIRLLGPVAHGDLPALIGAADVMALASASEGLANAWIEALASGTPIVIPDAGGAREVVTSPASGFIVPRNAAAFAAAIATLLAAPPATDAVAASVAHYSWDRNCDQLFEHLSALVARHRSAKASQSSG